MINGIEVEVDDLVDAENDSASENIDLAEEVVGDETLDIQFDYNGGHTNQPAAVDEASVNGNESVQFGHSEDDQQFGSDCEHTGTLCAVWDEDIRSQGATPEKYSVYIKILFFSNKINYSRSFVCRNVVMSFIQVKRKLL